MSAEIVQIAEARMGRLSSREFRRMTSGIGEARPAYHIRA